MKKRSFLASLAVGTLSLFAAVFRSRSAEITTPSRDCITVGGPFTDFPGFTSDAIEAAVDYARRTGVPKVRLSAGTFVIRQDRWPAISYQKDRPVWIIGAPNCKTILDCRPA